VLFKFFVTSVVSFIKNMCKMTGILNCCWASSDDRRVPGSYTDAAKLVAAVSSRFY